MLPQETLDKLQAFKKNLYQKPKPIIITRKIIIEHYRVYCRTCAVAHCKAPVEFRTEKKFNCYVCKNPA